MNIKHKITEKVAKNLPPISLREVSQISREDEKYEQSEAKRLTGKLSICYPTASRNSSILSGGHKPINSKQASSSILTNVMHKTQSKESHKINSQLSGKINNFSPDQDSKLPNSPKLPTMFPNSPQFVAVNSFKGTILKCSDYHDLDWKPPAKEPAKVKPDPQNGSIDESIVKSEYEDDFEDNNISSKFNRFGVCNK